MTLTTQGFILTTAAQIIADGADTGTLVIRTITLYNPNSTTSTFIIRKVCNCSEATEHQLRIIRFDDEVGALGTWSFGLIGMPIMLVQPDQRYEVVLDATPTLGIHWAVDLGRST